MKTEGCYDANFVVNGGTTSDKVGIMITLGAQWLLHGHWGNRDTPSVCEETLNYMGKILVRYQITTKHNQARTMC